VLRLFVVTHSRATLVLLPVLVLSILDPQTRVRLLSIGLLRVYVKVCLRIHPKLISIISDAMAMARLLLRLVALIVVGLAELVRCSHISIGTLLISGKSVSLPLLLLLGDDSIGSL